MTFWMLEGFENLSKAKKGQKVTDFITSWCKIINKWEFSYEKKGFFKNINFYFHYLKFLKLHFVKEVKISEDFWYDMKFC